MSGEPIKRVIWKGEHKNATRAVVTRTVDSYGPNYEVEMWQRPQFGIPYVKTSDRRLRYAFDAALTALLAYANKRREVRDY